MTSTNANGPVQGAIGGTTQNTSSAAILLHEFDPVKALYPPTNTIRGQVLAAMLERKEISALDIWRWMNSNRGSHFAWYLKHREGWPVVATQRTVQTGDGRNASVAFYSLPDYAIDAVGARGLEFTEQVRRARELRRAA